MARLPMWKIILVSSLLVSSNPVFAEDLPPLPDGPLILTSVTPEMLNADYWISKIPDPDAPIKTPEELPHFNKEIRAMLPEQMDVLQMDSSRSGKGTQEDLANVYKALSGRTGLMFADDSRVTKEFFEKQVKPVMAFDKVPSKIQLGWGAAVRAASVRAIPTDVKLIEKPGDIEFDVLQFTQIKLWTPVAIYHTSSDGKWYYIQAPYTRGWVRAKDIAVFPSRAALKKHVRSSKFLVVTGESVLVFADPHLTKSPLRASMGTILPLIGQNERTNVVELPVRGEGGKVSIEKGYLGRRADVSKGFPAFTQRNIIRQAFKLLGARYGWGGMYNGRDCSGFTHDVFLSVGVDMPRDSKQQSFVGTQLGHFPPFQGTEAKIEAIRSGAPGMTLLRMPMHLMLYLGEVNGQFYVIHSTWAERYSMTSDDKNRINQVVVSDLTLNGKSRIGSLFDRIIAVNEVN